MTSRLIPALGWLSVGLGAALSIAPGGMARLIGAPRGGQAGLRLIGFREIVAGAGLLSQRRAAPWLWARAAGDVIDLLLLQRTYSAPRSQRSRVAATSALIAGITAIDLVAARWSSQSNGATPHAKEEPMHVVKTVTIRRPASELYAFWRDFTNLPRIMDHLETVTVQDDRRSHWTAKAPGGGTVEWNAEMTEDVPNERIAWQSVEGSDIENRGSVRFTPALGDRGTEVRVEMEYAAPGGKIGALIAKLSGEEPDQQVGDAVRIFKQVMETGEKVQSDVTAGSKAAQPLAPTR